MKLSQLNLKVILMGLIMVVLVIAAYALINQPRQSKTFAVNTSTPTEGPSVQATQEDFNPATTDIPTIPPLNPLGSLPTAAAPTSLAGLAAQATPSLQPAGQPQPTTASSGGSNTGASAPAATNTPAVTGGFAPTHTPAPAANPTSTPQGGAIATHTPQPTPTGQAAPTASATPIPAQGGFSFTFLSSPISAGAYASAIINTAPNATCSITYTPPGGTAVNAPALAQRNADPHGVCSWSWLIAQGTISGSGTVVISANGLTQSYSITIQ